MKKEVRRMQNAMEAFIKSEESQQTLETRKKKTWFPMHVQTIIQQEFSQVESLATSLKEIYSEDEIKAFMEGLKNFGNLLKKYLH